ncbi:hypothetical protein [Nonomuraea jiangxiensis]|nr:hypothetical protein [Nonomuraea jiangxiensis]
MRFPGPWIADLSLQGVEQRRAGCGVGQGTQPLCGCAAARRWVMA